MRNQLLQEISEMRRNEQRTVLFSSHITQDIEQVADHIAIIHECQIVECCDKESLMDRWKKGVGTMPLNESFKQHQMRSMFKNFKISQRRFEGFAGCFSSNWLKSLEDIGVRNPKIHSVNLDDIIITLSKKGE